MTTPAEDARREAECYDAGLLNDYGGGNVEWWQDYLRAELGRAHDFYAGIIDQERAKSEGLRTALEAINRRASPSPSRTFDDCSADLYWCTCEARRALSSSPSPTLQVPGETEGPGSQALPGAPDGSPPSVSIPIAERRAGHSKLVYDKATRTIVTVPNKGHIASLTPREVADVARAICCPGGCKGSPGSTVCIAYQVEDVARGAIIAFLSAQGIVTGTDETRNGSVERSEIEPDGVADAPNEGIGAPSPTPREQLVRAAQSSAQNAACQSPAAPMCAPGAPSPTPKAFQFATASLRARGVGRVADEPRALLVLLTDIPGDDDIRSLHEWLVHQPAWRDAAPSPTGREEAVREVVEAARDIKTVTEHIGWRHADMRSPLDRLVRALSRLDTSPSDT